MNIGKRSSEERMMGLSPWRHEIDLERSSFLITENTFKNSFLIYDTNADLDIYSKRAALRSSEVVASLVSSIGGEIIFCASGTIIECNNSSNDFFDVIILTTASLLRSHVEDKIVENIQIMVYLWDGKSYKAEVLGYDPYFNMATVRIRSEVALKTAVLRKVDDSISISPTAYDSREAMGPILRRHSKKFWLVPGDKVVAVGRHHEQHDLMVAPALFSIKCGIGGPLLNMDGEVIGINFIGHLCTPILPSNVVSIWWRYFKKYGYFLNPFIVEFCRPWLGIDVANLYSGEVDVLENIVRKFPNISRGVIVEKVELGSPACVAGIISNDVIVRCDGKKVKSFFRGEFFKKIYHKIGEKVELGGDKTRWCLSHCFDPCRRGSANEQVAGSEGSSNSQNKTAGINNSIIMWRRWRWTFF
uniref:PDZ domain-containing protein n=1 Tax=Ananas comosus var. bracteatus TaxID=296719 RepID=A0A6V7NYS4_ANACO|nr:unnamed protein product [Ananas comosus var. bracteatus]